MTVTKLRGSNLHTWIVYNDTPISESEAKAIQNPDKPIAGYGFSNFTCVRDGDGYRATWYCSSSCE